MNSIPFGKGVIKSRSVFGSQAYRAQDSTYFNPFKTKKQCYTGCPVISYRSFRIRVLILCRLKEIASTCGRLATVMKLRDFEMLLNKDRWIRKHTSRSETRGSVYFILLYIVTVPLKHVFKMAAFGLYTQSGLFSAPREMGVVHHVGSNCDTVRAYVGACVSLF